MFKNRCYGCDSFGGFRSGDLVNCDAGHKNIYVRDGCSDFTPDITASCGGGEKGCWYNNGGLYSDIQCSIHGFLSNERMYCYDFAAKESIENSKPKSGCFVTTTVCDILGKKDNCDELETLRKFRDTKLLTNINLENLVFEYYNISPILVKIINNHKNKQEFAETLLNDYLKIIVEQIKNSEDNKAIALYKKMIKKIKKEKNGNLCDKRFNS
jgi:hypothetical protein